MKTRTLSAGLLAGAAAAAVMFALNAGAAPDLSKLAGMRADNFMLADQQGVGHELYYYKTNPAIVIVTHEYGDATSERAVAAIEKMRAPYESKGVVFFALNSSTRDNAAHPAALRKAISLPVLEDELQLAGRSLGVTSTAEVFVIDPKNGFKVAYHGPVDDSFAQKKDAGASLAAALDAVLAGTTAPVVEAKVKGTAVDFPDRRKTAEFKKLTYTKDVAPVLADNCVMCHAQGGVAPFAMNSYEVVKGFAPMIREALRAKRMPPWHADSDHAQFKNDWGISNKELLTVVNWIEAGAPRGEGEDPLARLNPVAPEWEMGKPDVVLELPPFDVPASGIVQYQHFVVPNPTKEEKFLAAVTYLPGASKAVHHIVAGWNPEGKASRGQGWEVDTGGWGPGSEVTRYPADTGNKVGANGSYVFQMHYTPNGKAQTDRTKVGIYYRKETPKHLLRQVGIADFSIEIPAGEGRHHERGYVEFPTDVLLYMVRPHAHSRAYATRLTVRYPDGTEKILHNQPRYDFNWQREYVFKDWMPIPAGSIMIADYIYDNSKNNVSNPDPKANVVFGEQTFEEMLFTYLHYRIVGEDRDHPKDDVQAEINRSLGFSVLDDNIDRKLTPDELRGRRFTAMKTNFAALDKNSDGGLDKAEYFAASAPRARAADASVQAAPAATPGGGN